MYAKKPKEMRLPALVAEDGKAAKSQRPTFPPHAGRGRFAQFIHANLRRLHIHSITRTAQSENQPYSKIPNILFQDNVGTYRYRIPVSSISRIETKESNQPRATTC